MTLFKTLPVLPQRLNTPEQVMRCLTSALRPSFALKPQVELLAPTSLYPQRSLTATILRRWRRSRIEQHVRHRRIRHAALCIGKTLSCHAVRSNRQRPALITVAPVRVGTRALLEAHSIPKKNKTCAGSQAPDSGRWRRAHFTRTVLSAVDRTRRMDRQCPLLIMNRQFRILRGQQDVHVVGMLVGDSHGHVSCRMCGGIGFRKASLAFGTG